MASRLFVQKGLEAPSPLGEVRYYGVPLQTAMKTASYTMPNFCDGGRGIRTCLGLRIRLRGATCSTEQPLVHAAITA